MDDMIKKLIEEIICFDQQGELPKSKEYQEYIHFCDMKAYENQLYLAGKRLVAGLDEVGRGPLAGPVVAACVILPEDFYLPGLDDSKKVSEKRRLAFYQVIVQEAITYGIGVATPEEIDQFNIYQATKLAMERALGNLTYKPDHLIIDAMKLDVDIEQTSLIKGDSRSVSVAAASILAKVTRDIYMEQMDLVYPGYEFKANKGYGTKAHLAAIEQLGITPIHRKSFEPIRSMIHPEPTLFDL